MTTAAPMPERAAQFRQRFAALEAEIGKVIVGQPETVRGVLTCLFVGGHVLLEGVPGLGKTLLVRTLAQALDLKFARVQFTPDLMPSDVIGTNIISEAADGRRDFRFQRGPLFAQIVLADEINRATPKTQSALLEAMQEHSVTVGGATHRLDEPFFVLATQNPIEQEGTYPLPEAQLDRFLFKLLVPFTTREELTVILDRTTRNERLDALKVMDAGEIVQWMGLVREILVAGPVQDYAIRLLLATHPQTEYAAADANRYLRAGGSPRGAQAIILAAKVRALLEGRFNVGFEDVRKVFFPAMRHRVLLNFEAQAENVSTDVALAGVLNEVKEKV
jgi:MoxR-like ATPase